MRLKEEKNIPDSQHNQERIALEECTQKDIERLTNHDTLKELVIDDYKDNILDIGTLRTCFALESLEILNSRHIQSIDLSPLSELPNFTELKINNIKELVSLDLEPLAKCSSLQKLNIQRINVDDIDLSPVLNLKTLKILNVGWFPLSEQKKKRTELRGLDGTSCAPLEYVRFAGLPNLRDIKLDFLSAADIKVFKIEKCPIESIDISSLSRQKNLEELVLINCELQEIDISSLTGLSKLKRIKISENQIESIDLSALCDCISLEELSLACNKLTEIDLSPLSSCVNLSIMSLAVNQLNYIDLTSLRDIQIGGVVLVENNMESVDITPIISPKLLYFEFGPDTKAMASKEVKHVSTALFERIYYERKSGKPGMTRCIEHGVDIIEWY